MSAAAGTPFAELLEELDSQDEPPSEPEAAAEWVAERIVAALQRLELDNLQTERGRRVFAVLVRWCDEMVVDHLIEALLP